MFRRTLQRLVRLSPNVARSAWQALPERAREALAPLVHPIAAGGREGAKPLPVECPARPARFDVVVAPGFELDAAERERLEATGHRVLDLAERTPTELVRELAVNDAVLLLGSAGDAAPEGQGTYRSRGATTHPAETEARRHGWRVAHASTDLEQAFPEVSIVIPTHAARDLCRSCLHSLLRFTGWGRLHVIIADDASSDGTRDVLRELSALDLRIEVVRLETRGGFARACNAALERASGEYVVLLNDDTVVSPGWLSRLVAQLERDEKLGMIGSVTNQIGNEAKIDTDYDSLDGMLDLARRRAVEHAAERFSIPTLALFCAALRLDVLRDVGLLDERFEIGMFEDDDLCRSLTQRGLDLAVARDAFVHHVGQATLGKLDDAEYLAVWEANKKRFEEKWGTAWRPPPAREHSEGQALRPPER